MIRSVTTFGGELARAKAVKARPVTFGQSVDPLYATAKEHLRTMQAQEALWEYGEVPRKPEAEDAYKLGFNSLNMANQLLKNSLALMTDARQKARYQNALGVINLKCAEYNGSSQQRFQYEGMTYFQEACRQAPGNRLYVSNLVNLLGQLKLDFLRKAVLQMSRQTPLTDKDPAKGAMKIRVRTDYKRLATPIYHDRLEKDVNWKLLPRAYFLD